MPIEIVRGRQCCANRSGRKSDIAGCVAKDVSSIYGKQWKSKADEDEDDKGQDGSFSHKPWQPQNYGTAISSWHCLL